MTDGWMEKKKRKKRKKMDGWMTGGEKRRSDE